MSLVTARVCYPQVFLCMVLPSCEYGLEGSLKVKMSPAHIRFLIRDFKQRETARNIALRGMV
jgi:hypothetical protein